MLEVSTDNPGVDRALRLATCRVSGIVLVLLAVQIVLLFVYIYGTGTEVTSTGHVLLPILWITLGVWMVMYLRAYGYRSGRSRFALALGVVYFGILAAIGGVVDISSTTSGFRIAWATPGWGPIVFYSLGPLQLVAVPFEIVGYVALSYGVYRAVASSSKGALAGLFGLFTCVGCVLPLVAAIGGFFGGAATALQPGEMTYSLATVIFVLTVVVLVVAVPTIDPNSRTSSD